MAKGRRVVAREPLVTESYPGRGLNAATLERMAHFARVASTSEPLRQMCERWLRDRRVPPRDDVAELHSLYELNLARIPYRKDPVYRERLKAPWVVLGLGGFEPGLGDDCETIACTMVAMGGCMGHQPGGFLTGLGRCPHEQRGNVCPHPRAQRAALYGDAPCCPDSEAHVLGVVHANRPKPQWVFLDPVAHPNPAGFRPELYFTRFFVAIGPEHTLGQRSLGGHEGSMSDIQIVPGTALPLTDPFIRWVQGRDPVPDSAELGAELAQAKSFQLERMPVGTVMFGEVGDGLALLGIGPLGGLYGDAGGGVWAEVPMAFGGIWSRIKKAARSVKSGVTSGAKFFHKLAAPASMVAALVPGVGTAVAAAIVAVDKGAQLAMQAAQKAEQLQAQVSQAAGRAKQVLAARAGQYEAQARALLGEASRMQQALRLPPGVASQVAQLLPATALVQEVRALARPAIAAAPAAVAQALHHPQTAAAAHRLKRVFSLQRDYFRRWRQAQGARMSGCPGGCHLERVA